MSRLTVVAVIPTLDQSGAEKQLALLAAHLPRDRFDVTVVALTRGGHYERILRDANVAVEIIGKRHQLDPFAWRSLVQILKVKKAEIVHTWLFAGNSYGRLAALRARIPIVIASERCVDCWKSRPQLWLDRQLAKWTDCLVVNSLAVANFYEGAGVPAEKLVVIPNAIEPLAEPLPSAAQVRAELGIPPDVKALGFVGRLWPQKRVIDLIGAMDVLLLGGWKVLALIIGSGPRRETLETYARQLEIADHIRFLGHRNDAQRLMAAMDVFVLPSDFEGMPNVVLEAMRAGLPVVASRIPGMDEVVIDGYTGLLFEPRRPFELARAVTRLLDNPTFAARIAQTAHQRLAADFSVSRMVAAYANLYERLAAQG